MKFFFGFVDKFEENFIVVFLGVMILFIFVNVVVCKGFNLNIFWGFEVMVFLFGWLVLLGVFYVVKKGVYLGVDVMINGMFESMCCIIGLIVISICIVFFFFFVER